MKFLLNSVCLILISSCAFGQVTLEQSYVVPQSQGERDVKIINLDRSGYKYCVKDAALNQVRLYNINHSLWKTVNITIPSGFTRWDVAYVSESLFNTDNSVEMLVSFHGNSQGLEKGIILNENGNTLLTIDTAAIDADAPMVQTTGGSTYKLVVKCGKSKWCVYSLPGTIPCDKCGNGLGVGMTNFPNGGGTLESPVPNPSKDMARIDYELPNGTRDGEIRIFDTQGRLVKSFKVDRTFNHITINNSDLSGGTYYYNLVAQGLKSETKRMVVIP